MLEGGKKSTIQFHPGFKLGLIVGKRALIPFSHYKLNCRTKLQETESEN